jgi:excisionase family DNA binding protein
MGKLLCSKKEAADTLGVSLRTVDNLIGRKELIVRRVGRRVLIPAREVERFTWHDHQTRLATTANAPNRVENGMHENAIAVTVLKARMRSKK